MASGWEPRWKICCSVATTACTSAVAGLVALTMASSAVEVLVSASFGFSAIRVAMALAPDVGGCPCGADAEATASAAR